MDRKIVEEFAYKSLWNLAELSDLCIGVAPGGDKSHESINARHIRASEEIHRSCLVGSLKYIDRSDSEGVDQLYGNHRFFKPSDAIAWAQSKPVLFPDFPDFSAFGFPASVPEPTACASETERNSLLKLVLVMAMSKYGYNPEARSNKATGGKSGSISADMDLYKLPLDPKTVRTHLNAASKKFHSEVLKNRAK